MGCNTLSVSRNANSAFFLSFGSDSLSARSPASAAASGLSLRLRAVLFGSENSGDE